MSKQDLKSADESRILKKHVSAIHAVADLTALQRKLVNALLLNAYGSLLTQRDHTVGVGLLCEMIGFDSKNIGYLKKALVGIMETVMQFDLMEDGEESWEAMSLLTYVKVKGGVVTYRYEQSLAEKLHHPEIYAQINLNVLRSMRSAYTLALYENCLRYIRIGHTPVWSLDTYRMLMGAQGRYKEFKFLKRDLIVAPMKEVNEVSNIQLELLTVRSGRSVTAVQFNVKPNPQMALLGMEEEDEISSTEAYKALLDQGISKALARSWVSEYGEKHVLDKVDLTKSLAAKGKITSSKTGFLTAAIERDFHNEDAQDRQRRADREAAQRTTQEKEDRVERLKTALRDVERKFRDQCREIIDTAIQDFSEDILEAYTAEFRTSLTSSIYVQSFNRSGWSDRLLQKDIIAFWETKGLVFPDIERFVHEASGLSFTEIMENIDKESL